MRVEEFDWTVDEARDWPPKGRPVAPMGPTEVEILRSCPLRMCFDRSSGYERRMSFDGRIGTAFHKVLESFRKQPMTGMTLAEAAEETRRRFAEQLRKQEQLADKRPRERGLPRDRSRIDRAVEALILAGQKSLEAKLPIGVTSDMAPVMLASDAEEIMVAETQLVEPDVEVEVAVTGCGGLLKGRVDRVEPADGGRRILDYKSALRDDLPARYERQVQLYALMWQETRGEWPVEGQVVYPMKGTQHFVSVEPPVCRQVAEESVAEIELAQKESSV